MKKNKEEKGEEGIWHQLHEGVAGRPPKEVRLGQRPECRERVSGSSPARGNRQGGGRAFGVLEKEQVSKQGGDTI